LIKLVRNIQCKCIKNVKAFGDGGWDLGCTMEVNVRDSYVYRLTLSTIITHKNMQDEYMK